MADNKLSQLVSTQAVDDTDLFATVQDMATTPITKGKAVTLLRTWMYTKFLNVAGTFNSILQNTATAARTYTFVDRNATVGNNINNYSTAVQTPAASTRVYLTGSAIAVPKGKLQIGTILRWRFDITKTAAGIAAWTVDVAFGTAGTTADTARVSFSIPAGTADVDNGWAEISVIIRGPLSASGIAAGHLQMTKSSNSVATGLFQTTTNLAVYNKTTVSSVFDVTVADLFVGLCITPGASAAYTIEMVTAEALNL